MGKFRTIKALVIDYVHRKGGVVSYGDLTKEVLRYFPTSRWKSTHWGYWRSQFLHHELQRQFTSEELKNLGASVKQGPKARNLEVKRAGDVILKLAREAIAKAAGDDQDLYFKLNRWVFARLQQDEITIKRPIKKALLESGMRTCQKCGTRFQSVMGVEIHRKDPARAYSVGNCELVCVICHRKL